MTKVTKTKVISYNCRGLKSAAGGMGNLLNECDICLLQEHWLTKEEVHSALNGLNNEFTGCGVSSMDTTKHILLGRPYGGTAILWRKSMQHKIKQMDTLNINNINGKIQGIEYSPTTGHKIVILSVYLPYDDGSPERFVDFIDFLTTLKCIIDNVDTNNVIMAGDFNADPNSRFGIELQSFCNEQSYMLCDILSMSSNTFTYISDAHLTTKWLDHCICTGAMSNYVDNFSVKDDLIHTSDHLPLAFDINVDGEDNPSPQQQDHIKDKVHKVNWSQVNEEMKHNYNVMTKQLLADVFLPTSILQCTDNNCTDQVHLNEIDKTYDSIIDKLKTASKTCLGSKANIRKQNVVPGWNEYVKQYHDIAKEKYIIWCQSGKPREGVIAENMRDARRVFKKKLKDTKAREDQIKADKMAQQLAEKQYKQFWTTVSKSNIHNIPRSDSIEDVKGASNIADLWREHYCNIFNSVDNNRYKLSVENTLSEMISEELCLANCAEVSGIIRSAASGKAPGADGLNAEHIKYCAENIVPLLSIIFNSMMIHSHVPSKMSNVVIVPTVKDKSCDVKSKSNYRPIVLANCVMKMYEQILLNRCSEQLNITDTQFGFQKGMSTEMCILALKETVAYYNSQDSPVYACFLDASKAFDRVNHWTLLDKLLKRGIPQQVVKNIKCVIRNQLSYIRWDDVLSANFKSTNGLKQGGLLSPLLYCVYIDDMLEELSSQNTGCILPGKCINNLCYADDLTILSPSIAGLRQLIKVCEKHADICDILFNANKTRCMKFLPKGWKNTVTPCLSLNGDNISFASSIKYLGHMIHDNLSDDSDINRQLRSLLYRGNVIIRKFARCSAQVKNTMFLSYCAPMYTASLWCSYKQSTYNKLRVSYNKVFRKLHNLAFNCSASGMFVSNNVPSFSEIIRKYIYSFSERVHQNTNKVLVAVDSLNAHCKVKWNEILYTI